MRYIELNRKGNGSLKQLLKTAFLNNEDY